MANSPHKSATEVTIAPLADKSPLQAFIERAWKPAAVIAVVIAGAVVFAHQRSTQKREARHAGWNRLAQASGIGGFMRAVSGDADQLAAVQGDSTEDALNGWSRLAEAQSRLDKRDFAGARAAAQAAKSASEAKALVDPLWLDAKSGSLEAAANVLLRSIDAQEAWEREHGDLRSNPPAPEGSPKVRLETEGGVCELTLYADRAPQHVAAFLAIVQQGGFNGAAITASADGAGVTLARTGDAPAEPPAAISNEASGLFHFAGALTSLPAPPSGGAPDRFAITTSPEHAWDGQRTVFGVVTAGLSVLEAARTPATVPGATEPASSPVVIKSATVL